MISELQEAQGPYLKSFFRNAMLDLTKSQKTLLEWNQGYLKYSLSLAKSKADIVCWWLDIEAI